MSNKYFRGDKAQYIFCDICGQACYAFEATKLTTATGRPGLIVCPNDVDQIDPGLLAYTVPAEKPVPFTRVNHSNVNNGAAVINYETSTELGA